MEEREQQIPAAEMGRMMKAQEVILKAAAGKLKLWERLNEHGYSGLWDYRKRSPSPKRVPMKTVEQVLQLYREKYSDFNVQHFHEKLRELHGIELSYTWARQRCKPRGWQSAGRSRDRTESGDRAGHCQACCCTSMAVSTAGL